MDSFTKKIFVCKELLFNTPSFLSLQSTHPTCSNCLKIQSNDFSPLSDLAENLEISEILASLAKCNEKTCSTSKILPSFLRQITVCECSQYEGRLLKIQNIRLSLNSQNYNISDIITQQNSEVYHSYCPSNSCNKRTSKTKVKIINSLYFKEFKHNLRIKNNQ